MWPGEQHAASGMYICVQYPQEQQIMPCFGHLDHRLYTMWSAANLVKRVLAAGDCTRPQNANQAVLIQLEGSCQQDFDQYRTSLLYLREAQLPAMH